VRVSTKELRRLEREYRRERAAILEYPELSWEQKMRAVLELFNRYWNREKDGAEEG
jgi:hypothetical protein